MGGLLLCAFLCLRATPGGWGSRCVGGRVLERVESRDGRGDGWPAAPAYERVQARAVEGGLPAVSEGRERG